MISRVECVLHVLQEALSIVLLISVTLQVAAMSLEIQILHQTEIILEKSLTDSLMCLLAQLKHLILTESTALDVLCLAISILVVKCVWDVLRAQLLLFNQSFVAKKMIIQSIQPSKNIIQTSKMIKKILLELFLM